MGNELTEFADDREVADIMNREENPCFVQQLTPSEATLCMELHFVWKIF